MGTHAMIMIENVEAVLYKHYDGYPESTLPWLSDFSAEFAKNRGDDPEYKFAQLVRSSAIDSKKYNLDNSRFTGWGIFPRASELKEAWIEYTYLLHRDGSVSFLEGFCPDEILNNLKNTPAKKQKRLPTVFQVYNDPGHGWVKVSRSLLDELEMTGEVSSYSYQRGKFVFLEEDLDASLLLNRLKARGVTPQFKSHHTNKQSKIRSYDHFKK